jgi:hypothetical protein
MGGETSQVQSSNCKASHSPSLEDHTASVPPLDGDLRVVADKVLVPDVTAAAVEVHLMLCACYTLEVRLEFC